MNRKRGSKLRVGALTDAVRGLLARVRLPRLRAGNRRRLGSRRTSPTGPLTGRVTGPVTGPIAAPVASRSPIAGAAPRLAAWARARARLGLGGRLRHLRTFLAWAAPLAVALVAFTLPVIGGRAYEYVMSSGYFHVREVRVDGASRIARDEVLAIAGITPGTHLLDADVDVMAERLRAHPWIRGARVERLLPDVLVVHLVEHRPTAFLAAGELYLVDESATPFMLAPVSEDLDLPVVTGLPIAMLTDPKQADAVHHALTGALNVARIWDDHGLTTRYPLGEIRIDGPRGYVVVIEAQNQQGVGTGQPVEVMLGRGPFSDKLYRLEWVLEHLHAQGKTPEYVVLDLADGAPADAEQLGGTRVVVKTELAAEDGAAPTVVPAPAPAPPPAPPIDDPSRSPSPRVGEDPADADGQDGPASEMVPLSGGRPAAEPGLEE
ncbi:MAG: FtsQ-type POTRA domain-containing protein [Deltaproteobacteria bacterium]|nr:FtsQ-type POTRA domain-containing protein [Deltaproteobacteria bacterium]